MAKVIKSSTPEADAVQPIQADGSFNLRVNNAILPADREMVSSAEKMMRDARAALEEARKKATEIEREAYQRGFAQGEKAGSVLGQQKLDPILKSLSQLVEEISTLRDRLLAENDQFIIQMGFLAASEIVHDEITARDDAVLNNVRASLEKVVRGAGMSLQVSPHDFRLIQAHLPELLTRVANQDDFKIEADAEIARGGCFLKTDAGDIDAQIDNQLAILRQRLLSDE